jgi:hypothetical protein
MCITQIWTYRECGCCYHHPVPCHPSFTPASTTPRRQRADPHLSNASSSPDRSPVSTNGSTFSSSDPLPTLSRQCSIRHVVHRNFLEPICDDCLLEELGLQPELGPILGGRDLKEGLHGEEWLLESSVEINIEESDDRKDLGTGYEQDDEEAADADDEGEFRGRSGRRRGMDISRDALRISSDLSADERESLALFREELRGVEPEGRRMARAFIKTHREGRRLKPSWSQQLRKGLSRNTKDDKRPISVTQTDDGSVESSERKARAPPSNDHDPNVDISTLRDNGKLSSDTPPEDARDNSFDTRDEIISLYETDPKHESKPNTQYRSWSEHLEADLQERHVTRNNPGASVLDADALQQCPRSPPLIPSSLQTATPFNSASWPPLDLQPLNIASSEFDKDDTPDPTATPQAPNGHAHTISADSTLSTSTFCTAQSSLRETTASASPASTRPTTATSSSARTPLSLHPLSTTLSIHTPHRPPPECFLTPRTSSLRSPPASSPLLHSTPPLHQSPTSVFACVHERWAFKDCGCEGPSWVRSCVCEPENDDGSHSEGSEEDAKDGCRATSPVVRTRWFFNPSCEPCLCHDGITGGADRG